MEPVEERPPAGAIGGTPQADGPDADEGHTAPRIMTINMVAVILAVILVTGAIFTVLSLNNATEEAETAHNEYNACSAAAERLMVASDYLTSQSRMYVVTGDRSYMDAYFKELLETKSRDNAVAKLDSVEGDERATARLAEALDESNELASLEFYAMRLASDALGIEPVPQAVANVSVKAEDDALARPEKLDLAKSMLLGEEYREMKAAISQDVDACAQELVQVLEKESVAAEERIHTLLFVLLGVAIILMALVAFIAVANYILVMRPMRYHAKDLEEHRPLRVIGSKEIRNVSRAFNQLHSEVQARTANLKQKAEIDSLTGAYNRAAYDRLLEEHGESIALILVDVDRFKQVNDEYGHETGDKVLKKVASAITNRFRSSDFVCRIGGDEFAVIAPKAGPESRDAIAAKLEAIAADMANAEDNLPETGLSFGVAFGDGREIDLFHAADKALYASKHKGRNTYTFAGEE